MEKDLPKRKKNRLDGYDYGSSGAYFFTICSKDRKNILSPTNEMVPHIVSTLKRLCNKEIGYNVFQRSYFDHIIRDKEDYNTRIRYINDNPMRWYYKNLNIEE